MPYRIATNRGLEMLVWEFWVLSRIDVALGVIRIMLAYFSVWSSRDVPAKSNIAIGLSIMTLSTCSCLFSGLRKDPHNTYMTEALLTRCKHRVSYIPFYSE